MANIIMGTKLGTGTGSSIPKRPPNQPPCTAREITPYAALIDRMFMIAAFNGTNTDRNTTISSRNETMMTAPMKTRRRSATSRRFSRSRNQASALVRLVDQHCEDREGIYLKY